MKYNCPEGECPLKYEICCYTCEEYKTCEEGKCDIPNPEVFVKCAEAVKE